MTRGKTLSLCLPPPDSSLQRRQKAIRRPIFPTKEQRPFEDDCASTSLENICFLFAFKIFGMHGMECKIKPETANIAQEHENIKNEF